MRSGNECQALALLQPVFPHLEQKRPQHWCGLSQCQTVEPFVHQDKETVVGAKARPKELAGWGYLVWGRGSRSCLS